MMYTSTIERFMDKSKIPSSSEINNLLGKQAVERLIKLETFLKNNYDLICELKFPFGNNYGWGYINTLTIQQVLSEKKWYDMMAPEDFRALTPLIYNHVNPYGNFDLDMNQRIPIDMYNNAVQA